MPPKSLRVRAVGEGESAFSCPRADHSIRHGSRFIGRDAQGRVRPEGEEVPWSLHVVDLLNQGQLERVVAADAPAKDGK
jgi:hypothetical protein